MATRGSEVPWWRVVGASGAPAAQVADRALPLLKAEETPLRGRRVDLDQALHIFDLPTLVLANGDDEDHEGERDA